MEDEAGLLFGPGFFRRDSLALKMVKIMKSLDNDALPLLTHCINLKNSFGKFTICFLKETLIKDTSVKTNKKRN